MILEINKKTIWPLFIVLKINAYINYQPEEKNKYRSMLKSRIILQLLFCLTPGWPSLQFQFLTPKMFQR